MIDYALNKAQADELFDQNAVMMGEYGTNVIYNYKVAEIFGETIFTWAERAMHSEHAYIKGGEDWNTWGDCGCDYFYRSGFRKIVSQHNYLVSMEQYKASEGGKLCEALREARRKEYAAADAEEERKYQERRAKAKAAREARAAKKAQREASAQ